jgi:hypothetical protein
MAVRSDVTAERVARNQSTFRDASERIRAATAQFDDLERVPFLCECPERDCTTVIRLSPAEYEAVRQQSDQFFVAPGHEVTSVDGIEPARIVERRTHLSLLEKIGERASWRGSSTHAARGALMDERVRRIGLNEALVRLVNEEIEGLERRFAPVSEQTLQIVCECGDLQCSERLPVEIAQYERVRADPTLFIVVPGHELPELEDVVASTEPYSLVRKREGDPTAIARSTDPRA